MARSYDPGMPASQMQAMARAKYRKTHVPPAPASEPIMTEHDRILRKFMDQVAAAVFPDRAEGDAALDLQQLQILKKEGG